MARGIKARKEPRHQPPSRIRYNQKKPVVSIRVPKDILEGLRLVKGTTAESMTRVFLLGLGYHKLNAMSEKAVWQKGYDKGFDEGANAACNYYVLTYLCSVCGEEVTVDTEEEKKAIREYIRKHGWGHSECLKKQSSEE